jgi:hypothetical protein
VQVDDSFLEALLDDVFRVFSDRCKTSRNGENPSLVTLDENVEGVCVSTFGGKDERRFFVEDGGFVQFHPFVSLAHCRLLSVGWEKGINGD